MNLSENVICTTINGESYYSIVQAYFSFKSNLTKKFGFNSFYKYFAKWRVENDIRAESLNVSKLYSTADILKYIDYLNANCEVDKNGI